MPSEYFQTQFKVGSAFETSVAHLLEAKGWEVEMNDSPYYEELKVRDLIARNRDLGKSFWIETKKDVMSQLTGNVCIEYGALEHSKVAVFVIGLPNDYWTDIYVMPLKVVLNYARQYPIKKRVGEFKVWAALIPKQEFIYLPFVKRLTN